MLRIAAEYPELFDTITAHLHPRDAVALACTCRTMWTARAHGAQHRMRFMPTLRLIRATTYYITTHSYSVHVNHTGTAWRTIEKFGNVSYRDGTRYTYTQYDLNRRECYQILICGHISHADIACGFTIVNRTDGALRVSVASGSVSTMTLWLLRHLQLWNVINTVDETIFRMLNVHDITSLTCTCRDLSYICKRIGYKRRVHVLRQV